MRDDAVPEEFGRENIRIVEGLIQMFAGLGGVITNEIAGIMNRSHPDTRLIFRFLTCQRIPSWIFVRTKMSIGFV